jgi:glycosyltransferase involved in cell wall biosynthesis
VSATAKLGFYSALYLDYAGLRRGKFSEPSDAPPAAHEHLRKGLRIHFWAPGRSAGAEVTVYDVLPALQDMQTELGAGWNITAGDKLPEDSCDWLICFKAVPDSATRKRHKKTVMLICDQADLFWDSLSSFDMLIATSSRPFASVIACTNANTIFIGETEPLDYIESGRAALGTPPSKREPILMWHGGAYSLGALYDLKDVLAKLAPKTVSELHIISGQKPERSERWGDLHVRFLPWSKPTLKAVAARARLGIIPARSGARLSYIKPASRIRCLYALGVPAIADRRVPDAIDFARTFDSPISAGGTAAWEKCVRDLMNAPAELDRLALAGHDKVAANFSTRNTAARWVRLLGLAQ